MNKAASAKKAKSAQPTPSSHERRQQPSRDTKSSSIAGAGSKQDPAVVPDDEGFNQDESDSGDSTYISSQHEPAPKAIADTKQRKKALDDLTLSELRKVHTKVKQDKAKINKEKEREKKMRVDLQKEVRQLGDMVRKLENDKQQLKSQFDADLLIQREKFASAGKAMQELLKKEKSAVLPDDVVREHFSALASECKIWVQTWCSPRLDLTAKNFLLDILLHCVDDHDPSHVEQVFQKLVKSEGLAVRILLRAEMSRRVFEIFRSPFFLLESWDTPMEDPEEFFEEAHQIFKIVNPWKAHKWRADTCHMLTLVHNSKKLSKKVFDLKFVDRQCRERSQDAIRELGPSLLRSVSDTNERKRRADQLYEMFKQSTELAILTHAQEDQTFLPKLSYLFEQPFRVNSEIFEPHPSMALESNDYKYDGRSISLLVTPLVKAVAHAEDSKATTVKVWLKAVVLILEDEEVETKIDPETQATVNPSPYQDDTEGCSPSNKRQKTKHSPCPGEKDHPLRYGSETTRNQNPRSVSDEQILPAPTNPSSHASHIRQHRNEITSHCHIREKTSKKNEFPRTSQPSPSPSAHKPPVDNHEEDSEMSQSFIHPCVTLQKAVIDDDALRRSGKPEKSEIPERKCKATTSWDAA